MQSDITLEYKGKTLIIDAKCYGQILKVYFDKEILSSAHVNQIFSYVIHEGHDRPPEEVQGMLLYALTESADSKQEDRSDCDHRFHCRTLDLNQEFPKIAGQLDDIAKLITEPDHQG